MRLSVGPGRGRLLAAVVATAVLLGAEAWLLAGKRSGEVAYLPAAAETVASLEVYGEIALSQTFVPGADGLESITLHPRSAGRSPVGAAELVLEADGDAVAQARATVPAAALVAAEAWTWRIPRIEASAGRRFRITVRVPAAARGEGLTFELGPPDYRWGELRIGGRQQWGDLKFATGASRARTLDTLRQLRRTLPWPFGTDTVLVLALLVLNAALVAVGVQLGAPD
jgi:hypothetical protein